MSGDGTDDVKIPSVFLTHANGKLLSELLNKEDDASATSIIVRLQEPEATWSSEGMFPANTAHNAKICTSKFIVKVKVNHKYFLFQADGWLLCIHIIFWEFSNWPL